MGSETRKKTKIARVRMTPEEWQTVEELAGMCSLSVPEFMRRTALGYTPKSNIDAQHRLNVAKQVGDLGRLGGLLKMWLSDPNKKQEGRTLRVPTILNEIVALKKQIEEEYRNLK